MTFITLEEAKMYLRVDSADEDAVIGSLLSAAGNLCRDVARLSSAQWRISIPINPGRIPMPKLR